MKRRLLPIPFACLFVIAMAAACTGCIPIEITKTITIHTNAPNLPVPPGVDFPDSFAPDPVDVCEVVPEEYQDLDALLRKYADELGIGFVLNYIQVKRVDIVKVAMEITDGEGSFEGITEVSVTRNGEYLASATPGDGLSATEILLAPESPINLLTVLDECPTVGFALRGTMPENPPDAWDNLVTLHVVAEISF